MWAEKNWAEPTMQVVRQNQTTRFSQKYAYPYINKSIHQNKVLFTVGASKAKLKSSLKRQLIYMSISNSIYDQILSVPSEPAESKNSPVLSNNTVWTASSWPVSCDCFPEAISYIRTEPSLLATARTVQLGSNDTRLAGCGPRSTLAMQPTVRTSHNLMTP